MIDAVYVTTNDSPRATLFVGSVRSGGFHQPALVTNEAWDTGNWGAAGGGVSGGRGVAGTDVGIAIDAVQCSALEIRTRAVARLSVIRLHLLGRRGRALTNQSTWFYALYFTRRATTCVIERRTSSHEVPYCRPSPKTTCSKPTAHSHSIPRYTRK